MAALGGDVVDEAVDDLLRHLAAQLHVVHVDVPHGLSLQQLMAEQIFKLDPFIPIDRNI